MPNTHLMDFRGARFNIVQFPVLKCVGMLSGEHGFQAEEHSHPDAVELLYILQGDSGWVDVGGVSYPLYPGAIAIYNPGMVHRETWVEDRRMQILYHLKFAEFQLSGLPPNIMVPEGHSPVINTGEYAPFIEQCLRTLFDECSRRDAGCEQICHHLLQSLMIVLLRLINRNGDIFEEIPGDSLAWRAKEYIEENYQRRISVRDIADSLHISYYHLSHIYKQELNISPQDYLIGYRMNQACRLLTSTDMPISQIARNIGYSNQSHFNVQFKAIKGLSPGQYRKAYADVTPQG